MSEYVLIDGDIYNIQNDGLPHNNLGTPDFENKLRVIYTNQEV